MEDEIRNEKDLNDDGIQHGIDDDSNNDPKKARNIGAVGGAVTGLAAGSMAGPLGAVGGAIVGGVAGALGSQAAVNAVDKHDNDDNMTGLGDKVQYDNDQTVVDTTTTRTTTSGNWENTTGVGNGEPGIQTGGHANDGTADTRGITEKIEDTVTGDNIDDKTGKRVDGGRLDPAGDRRGSYAYVEGDTPGIQTGGHDADGSPDTRGITEKVEDAVTGDDIDDKTGKRVD
jgi:hypothetical protein